MFLLPFSSFFEVAFIDLFSSFVFLDYMSPFNICCKAGLVVLNSLNFCFLSEKLFIYPSILNEILAGNSSPLNTFVERKGEKEKKERIAMQS